MWEKGWICALEESERKENMSALGKLHICVGGNTYRKSWRHMQQGLWDKKKKNKKDIKRAWQWIHITGKVNSLVQVILPSVLRLGLDTASGLSSGCHPSSESKSSRGKWHTWIHDVGSSGFLCIC